MPGSTKLTISFFISKSFGHLLDFSLIGRRKEGDLGQK